MTTAIINILMYGSAAILTLYNLKFELQGKEKRGKIARALGESGYTALLIATATMLLVSVMQAGITHFSNTFLGKAGLTLQFIIAADNFFNGNDPPKRRRRQWVKNKFTKLAPSRAS